MEELNFKASIKQNVKCWNCQYCSKEYKIKDDRFVVTRTGYCNAEGSAVNGKNKFHQKVYADTIQKECSEFSNINI